MATGWGADPMKNAAGIITAGTSSEDIRKILGALYTPGLVKGGAIKTSASSMTYTVSEGVGVFKMSSTENVVGRWTAANELSSPSTALPRTDYIYAIQRTPADNQDASLVVQVGTSLPTSRVVLLGAYRYSAGATSSNDGVSAMPIDYSIPYGSSLGELARGQSTWNGPFTDRQTMFTFSFYLPTDRLVSFNFQTVLSAANAGGFSASAYCETSYSLKVDGSQIAFWRSSGLHQAWTTFNWEERRAYTAGTHTVTLNRGREIGPGTPYQHYIPTEASGALLTVNDIGVVK